MSSGGGGQSGETRYNWNPAIEGLWAGHEGQYADSILNRANNLSRQPYEQFGDPSQYIGNTPGTNRIAGLDPYQQTAQQGIYHTIFGGGAADTEAARQQNLDTSQGAFLPGGAYGQAPARVTPQGQFTPSGQNPYSLNRDVMGMNPYGAVNSDVLGMNAYVGKDVKPESNEFMGDSPYFRGVLQQGQQDITDAYRRGTAADTNTMFAHSGAFGGSAHQEAVQNNQNALARNLGNFQNQMANQQYERSAGLREADIGRRLGADQYNVGQGFNAYESLANRALQGSLADLSRGAGAYENLASRAMGQGQFDASLGSQNWENQMNRLMQGYENSAQRDLAGQQFNSQMGQGAWDAERNRMMQGSQMGLTGQGLSFDAYNQLANQGGLNRGITQQALDAGYGDWANQQNWDRGNLGWLANLVSQAQGSTGSTSTFQGYQSNPLSQLAGLGLLGTSVFGR